jgi:diguanylate cyclase (GGDEF)-like protein
MPFVSSLEEATLSQVLDAIPGSAVLLDVDGCIVAVNDQWETFAIDNGGESVDWVGIDYMKAIASSRQAVEAICSVLARDTHQTEHLYPCHAADGSRRWFRMVARPAGRHTLVTHLDITNERLRALHIMDDAPVGFIELDTNLNAVVVPASWERDTGQRTTAAEGSGWLDIFPDDHRRRVSEVLRSTLDNGGRRTVDVAGVQPATWWRLVVTPLKDGLIVSIVDLSEDRRQTAELRHAATHDDLTGLATRGLFEHRLRQIVARLAARDGAALPAGVLFLDLDDFKAVNDVHGHVAGDQILRMTAERLAAGLREGDHAARVGGDEFVALLGRIDGAGELEDIATRLATELRVPVQLDTGAQVVPTVSIGAMVIDGSIDAPTVLHTADRMMYVAKGSGQSVAVHTLAVDDNLATLLP